MESLTVNIIQAMLAPGLMISACGLFLLGMNNKYSIIVNRIRLLNEEKRNLSGAVAPAAKKRRRHSITLQLLKLNARFKLVRNAVLAYSLAVALFIFASLLIGFNFISRSNNAADLAMLFFLGGMILVLLGICFAGLELWKGFQIVQIEIDDPGETV